MKWLAVCLNFDYDKGSVDLFLNGNKADRIQKNEIKLPKDSDQKSFIVRIGKFFVDGTPLIGKIVDINIWDRLGRI